MKIQKMTKTLSQFSIAYPACIFTHHFSSYSWMEHKRKLDAMNESDYNDSANSNENINSESDSDSERPNKRGRDDNLNTVSTVPENSGNTATDNTAITGYDPRNTIVHDSKNTVAEMLKDYNQRFKDADEVKLSAITKDHKSAESWYERGKDYIPTSRHEVLKEKEDELILQRKSLLESLGPLTTKPNHSAADTKKISETLNEIAKKDIELDRSKEDAAYENEPDKSRMTIGLRAERLEERAKTDQTIEKLNEYQKDAIKYVEDLETLDPNSKAPRYIGKEMPDSMDDLYYTCSDESSSDDNVSESPDNNNSPNSGSNSGSEDDNNSDNGDSNLGGNSGSEGDNNPDPNLGGNSGYEGGNNGGPKPGGNSGPNTHNNCDNKGDINPGGNSDPVLDNNVGKNSDNNKGNNSDYDWVKYTPFSTGSVLDNKPTFDLANEFSSMDENLNLLSNTSIDWVNVYKCIVENLNFLLNYIYETDLSSIIQFFI